MKRALDPTKSASPPIGIFLVGREQWLQQQVLQQLQFRFLTEGFESTDFTRWFEPPEDFRVILDALSTAPFGSPVRLVAVAGCGKITEKKLPWLTSYLKKPSPKTCLVLSGDEIDRKLSAAAAKAGVQVQICQPLRGRQLMEWVLSQTRQAGKQMDQATAQLLVSRTGSDLSALDQGIETLSLYAGEAPQITRPMVEALLAPSVQETAFDILDAAASGRPDQAIQILHQARSQGSLVLEQLMGAAGWYLRMAWKSKTGSGRMGYLSDCRRAALQRLVRWPVERFSQEMESVCRMDVRIKQGETNPELLADQMLLQLSHSGEGRN